MGAGKTSFLKRLKSETANQTSYLDLDQIIFEKYGAEKRDLAQVIEQLGWEKFREIEVSTLKTIAESSLSTADVFISLGGGTVTDQLIDFKNKNKNCFLVWLNTPLATCLKRIEGDDSRPLAQKGAKYLKDLYEKRVKYYQLADICLSASNQDMVWTAKSLKERLLS